MMPLILSQYPQKIFEFGYVANLLPMLLSDIGVYPVKHNV